MLLWPAKLANTRTPTPLTAKEVMNDLRPEWLEALLRPARLYVQKNHWQSVLAEKPSLLLEWKKGISGLNSCLVFR